MDMDPQDSSTIDVHNHVIPPFLIEELSSSPDLPPALMLPAAREWTPAAAVEQLDRHAVAAAVLSGVPLHSVLGQMGQERVAQLARRINEFAVRLSEDHPGRFGLFSFLPMPDVDRSLVEIEYSLDVLGANGVGLFTRYGEQWIADPRFLPVLEELNRRRAVVFCHPDLPSCCCGDSAFPIANMVHAATGYPYDTGRAVFALLLSGTLNRYPGIQWIFCHGGGPVPVLAGRVREMVRSPEVLERVAPKGVDHELQRLYYDTANAAHAATMAALLAYVPLSQVLFGTDAPYFGIDRNLASLHQNGLNEEQLDAVKRGNALELIPGIAK